ncbi:hypothetical protein QWY93_14080 [Echinicola jeungdonensis]|uniref:Uncharacterized protein n=1 Tax=Echinicola jeungdonensis TaxID=709343 RepID=A0ABV5J9E4_9BACT|nr:hypothetical protein [Echinicola jeungdonensis]MDN3670446.1 hypothetical protein [Echinicola jeungdonensis]
MLILMLSGYALFNPTRAQERKFLYSQLIDAINWTIASNKDKDNQYFGKVDNLNIAVFSRSCGGLQSLEIAPDPRVTTVVVCNSGILAKPCDGMPGMLSLSKDQLKKLDSPTLYLLGG